MCAGQPVRFQLIHRPIGQRARTSQVVDARESKTLSARPCPHLAACWDRQAATHPSYRWKRQACEHSAFNAAVPVVKRRDGACRPHRECRGERVTPSDRRSPLTTATVYAADRRFQGLTNLRRFADPRSRQHLRTELQEFACEVCFAGPVEARSAEDGVIYCL